MVLIARSYLIATVLLCLACSSTPCTPDAIAERNRARVNKVRLGQTLVEVERVMGPPERRAARLRYDGVSIEEWSYVTDPMRRMDALILFVGGKVEEIQSTSWDKRIRDELVK